MPKLDAEWLNTEATQRVFALLEDAGHQIYAVGGCVRDSLLGRSVTDIDLSTSALPEVTMKLAEEAGLRVIPTGIEHGTVTVMAADVPYEITTFRRDVETDGRRAVVAFSKRVEDDALRRDFTMNALYCDARGDVRDPLGGLPDLKAGRVRFIEDAVTRIREDHLRSLRYFRFFAWYGDASEGFDPDALDAIARHIEGLGTLSRERVGAEVKRLLAAPDPAPALAGMRATGALAAILPGASDAAIGPLILLEDQAGMEPDALRRLAVIGGEDVADRLRLSRKDAGRLQDMVSSVGIGARELGYRLGEKLGRDVVLVSAASLGVPLRAEDLADVAKGATQVFPLQAADLMPEHQGPELGRRLKAMERRWIDSGFALTRTELLSGGG